MVDFFMCLLTFVELGLNIDWLSLALEGFGYCLNY